jgi:hypothetical protein
MLWIIKMAIGCALREGNDGPRSKAGFFMRTLTGAITALVMVAELATPAIPQARTSEPSAAELPFARSRDGIRETYILSFGLFGPESVFASEAEKAAEILQARLQPDAQLLVRFNHKRGGSATSATLAAALRSAGHAMDPEKDVLVVFLTSHGSPDGLAVVAGRRSETLSPRSFRSMLNASGARYRVVIISACYSGVFARALADPRTLVITAAAPDRPSFGCEDGANWTYFGEAFFNQALRRDARQEFLLAQVGGFDLLALATGPERQIPRLQIQEPHCAAIHPGQGKRSIEVACCHLSVHLSKPRN